MSRTVTFEVELEGEASDEDAAFTAGVGTAHLEMAIREIEEVRIKEVRTNY